MAPDDQFQSIPKPPTEPAPEPTLQSLSILDCYDEAWSLFRRFIWWILGLQIAWLLINKLIALFNIAFLPVILMFFVTLPLGLGYNLIFIRFARGERPQATDWYIGFRRYGRVLGMFLGFGLLAVAAMIPPGIVWLVSALGEGSTPPIVGLFLGLYLIGIGLLGVYVIYVFTVMADVTEVGVMQAFQTGVDLVKGNWIKVVGLLFSVLPLSLAGVLLTSLPQLVRFISPEISLQARAVLWLFLLPGSAILGFTSLIMNRAYVKLRAINGLPEPPPAESAPVVEPGPELPMAGV